MKKIILMILSTFSIGHAFADSTNESAPISTNESSPLVSPPIYKDINANDNYIREQSYLQNPYLGLPSGGGTQLVTPEQKAAQNFAEKLFADGTWNAYGFSAVQQNNNKPVNFNVSGGIFGQTGSVEGFSLGGTFVAGNPFIQNNNTASGFRPYVFMASEPYYALTEGFLEYQYSHIVQADVGFIGINNSPWLAANYYSDQSSAVTYQGASVNVNPGGGWLFTGIAFNGANYPGYSGFTGNTLYNPGSIQGISTGINQGSNGTLAFGTSYFTPDNMYNVRAWAYQFDNYATLVYADNSIKLTLDKDTNTYFTIAAQGGTEWGNTSNAITSANLGNINSNFAGAQAVFNHRWFNVSFGYENVWGPADAFGHGAIVSPYTYNENVDPMYANSWMTGLVQKASSGQMYNITTTFSFLENTLSVAPAYSQILNTVGQQANSSLGTSNPDQEFDLVFNYKVKQIPGLKFFGVYGYMWNDPYTPYNSTTVASATNAWTTLFMTEYVY